MEQIISWKEAVSSLSNSDSHSIDRALFELQRALADASLAGHEIDVIGRALQSLDEAGSSRRVVNVALVAGSTSAPLANAARVAFFKEGFLANVWEAPFASVHQVVLDATSPLYSEPFDFVLLALTTFDLLGSWEEPSDSKAAEQRIVEVSSSVDLLWRELAKLQKPILQHTLVPRDWRLTGSGEDGLDWSMNHVIKNINKQLQVTAPSSVFWVDVNRIAMHVGYANWYDPKLWFHGKYAFSGRCLPEYAADLQSVIRSVIGQPPKVLVTDLDNTLWGGVIGDDGLDGIQLGPNTPSGEAFLELCHYLKALSRRGVILAICSKNELSTVERVFEKHPSMPLSLSDFGAVRCNWSDKAQNLREIAAELNLSVSSLVFIDDNPAECLLVRQNLPEVRVLNLGGDPASLVRRLDNTRWFESRRLTLEDLGRSRSYQARAASERARASTTDLAGFLDSLNMAAHLVRAGTAELPRLAQLEAKTNQFNLTTRRLRLDQLEEFARDPARVVFAVSLSDRFGDHGIVASLVAEFTGDVCFVTDWLMSCRVFSRTLEHFMLAELVNEARTRGMRHIRLIRRGSDKNTILPAVFRSIGLRQAGSSEQSSADETWEFDVGSDLVPQSRIRHKKKSALPEILPEQ